MSLYLIRHTTPAIEPGVCYGQSDVGLTDLYQKELASIRQQLPSKQIDLCVSSPLSRCLQLAKDLRPKRLITDPRLMELNFGEWEMKRWDELGQKGAYWGDHFVTERCPGGESFLDLQKRVLECWNSLQQNAGNCVAIVTHAAVIRTILAHQNGWPLERAFDTPVAYGQVIAIEPRAALAQ